MTDVLDSPRIELVPLADALGERYLAYALSTITYCYRLYAFHFNSYTLSPE